MAARTTASQLANHPLPASMTSISASTSTLNPTNKVLSQFAGQGYATFCNLRFQPARLISVCSFLYFFGFNFSVNICILVFTYFTIFQGKFLPTRGSIAMPILNLLFVFS